MIPLIATLYLLGLVLVMAMLIMKHQDKLPRILTR